MWDVLFCDKQKQAKQFSSEKRQCHFKVHLLCKPHPAHHKLNVRVTPS